MIGRRATFTALLASLVASLGLALGNGPLIAIGLTLGAYVAWMLNVEPVGGARARITLDRTRPRVGDLVTFTIETVHTKGWGPYLVHQPLPDALQLASGTNLAVGWKGRKTAHQTFQFRVRCATRGRFELEPARAISPHIVQARAATTTTLSPARDLTIAPRVRAVPRIRRHRGTARLRQAAGDRASIGDRGSDFHELRNYVAGDPLHAVNWRATARRSTDDLQLTVNEHEPEGKKSVWLFLDAGAHMEVGHTTENSLDRVIEGALGLLEHYARRGHRIGLTVYHQAETRVLYPDVGTRQMGRITNLLSRLNAHAGGEGLDRAVLRSRGFLVRERPLVLLVTRPEADAATTSAGISQLQRLLSHGRHAPPIQLLAPAPIQHGIAGGHHPLSVQTLHVMARATYTHLRRQGVRVIDWDPATQPLETLLTREVVR